MYDITKYFEPKDKGFKFFKGYAPQFYFRKRKE